MFPEFGNGCHNGGDNELAGDQLTECEFSPKHQPATDGKQCCAGNGLQPQQSNDLAQEDSKMAFSRREVVQRQLVGARTGHFGRAADPEEQGKHGDLL